MPGNGKASPPRRRPLFCPASGQSLLQKLSRTVVQSEGRNINTIQDLYSEYPALLRHVQRFDAPDAEEAVQAAYVTAWRLLEAGEARNPRALLYKAAENNALDQHRSARREPIPVGLIPDIAKLEEDGLLARVLLHTIQREEFAEDFDEAVRGLEETDRDAYILTELRGLSTREAGTLLDTSHMTTSRRAERARLTVRKELA